MTRMNSMKKNDGLVPDSARRASFAPTLAPESTPSTGHDKDVKVRRSTMTDDNAEERSTPSDWKDTDTDDRPIDPEILERVEKYFSECLPAIEDSCEKELEETLDELEIVIEEQAGHIADGLKAIQQRKDTLKELDTGKKTIRMQQQEIIHAMQDKLNKIREAVDERESRERAEEEDSAE